MSDDLFDASAMYDDDYLHFFNAPAGATGLIESMAGIEPGMTVLDLGCGPGALAAALAARGCHVTGLDFSPVFLAHARTLSAEVTWVQGDMRALPADWTGRFDRVLNWSTAFGYFDDDTNRAVLAGIARVLRPGGRLAMDLDNLTSFLSAYSSPFPSCATGWRQPGSRALRRTARTANRSPQPTTAWSS